MNKNSLIIGILVLLITIGLSGCVTEDIIVSGTGEIRFIDLEGGFYGIVAKDGERYDPINLSPDFKEDGLRIRFEGKIIKDQVSIHQWGTTIELLEIGKIEENETIIKTEEGNFSIASWNLQVFGPTKASNQTLLSYYAEKLDDYDLFVVQEIRDASGNAIKQLASNLPTYDYILSERAGRSTSKEQYAIFYNNRSILINYSDWTPMKQNEFERPPFQATFSVQNWTFTLFTIHIKPSDVSNELSYLENLTGVPANDSIILGDLNADGDYYNENNIAHFKNWSWVIANDMDTTVAANNNTYDRIIINNATFNNFLNAGVMDNVTKDQSDHYLVYSIFNPEVP